MGNKNSSNFSSTTTNSVVNKISIGLNAIAALFEVIVSICVDWQRRTSRNTVELIATITGRLSGGFIGNVYGGILGGIFLPGIGVIIGEIIGTILGSNIGSQVLRQITVLISDLFSYDIRERNCPNCNLIFNERTYLRDEHYCSDCSRKQN